MVVGSYVDNTFLSPFRKHPYTLNTEYTADEFRPLASTYELEDDRYSGYVEEGLHTFADVWDVKDEARRSSQYSTEYYVVVKCTIPKGTRYFKGIWHSQYGIALSYASEKLIVHSFIDED
ncbi:hypothetical protein Xoosp13_397 [Xanthomonas phage Xoo-sp13]|nr:hypothetical protein Xoosp13_397 [Xanthomonas phage Xoo-sp13]